MLIIVAFDGNNIAPYKTDIVFIEPGETVDFIIFTDQPTDNYRINFITTAAGDFTGVSFVSYFLTVSSFCLIKFIFN